MGGKTSAKSKNDWIAKAYDRINLTVPKGRKEAIQAAASAEGISLNAYVSKAIDERMTRPTSAQPDDVANEQTTPPEAVQQAEGGGCGFRPESGEE